MSLYRKVSFGIRDARRRLGDAVIASRNFKAMTGTLSKEEELLADRLSQVYNAVEILNAVNDLFQKGWKAITDGSSYECHECDGPGFFENQVAEPFCLDCAIATELER